MIYLILGAIIASSSLTIIRDRNTFFNCPVKIEALSVAFPASKLISIRVVNKFSAVYSAFVRSRV
jgi:hypothetical protein